MIIQFPKQRQKSLSLPEQPQSERPLGLYLLLCFILLYLTAILWVQRDLQTPISPTAAASYERFKTYQSNSLNSPSESESFRAVK
jgi:hypothetical protein